MFIRKTAHRALARIAAACALALAASGCASFGATEADQLAYRGTGPNPCLFGGATPRAEHHCAEQRWGTYGLLISVNTEALAAGSGQCFEHAARVQKALAGRADLDVKPIYSCPTGAEPCHVSVLVTDQRGDRFVVDNGFILQARMYPSAVGEFDDFSDLLGGAYAFSSDGLTALANARR